MTMIDVDTSPLQAAREWRGISLVAAARNSGLMVAQAEALEEGDPAVFDSIDEMIASAVVYGASIGIGRDEAMALLDRTVCRVGAQVDLPDITADAPSEPNDAAAGGFSQAVRAKSAQMVDHHRVLDPILDEEMVETGPTPEQAVQASGEIHIDSAFGPGTPPWDRGASSFEAGSTGELEAWASDDFGDVGGDREEFDGRGGAMVRRPLNGDGVLARAASTSQAALERLVGTDRSDAVVEWTRRASDRIHEATRDGRERLRRSEHATLIVAIGGGAVLIALLVAIGGALGGEDVSDQGQATHEPTLSTPGAQGVAEEVAPAKPATTAPAAKPTPMLAPSSLTIDIFNDGRRKGYAKEVAALLEKDGYGIGDVTNARGDYPDAIIIHPKGMQREARILGKRLDITNLQEMTGTSRRFTVIVK